MELDTTHALDAAKNTAKEIAETAETKTSEIHDKYVSKVLPDCGKYGDAAQFAAELIPGVSEYNAIRDGNWKAFAIAAGVDVAAISLGAASAGAGYAAVKGGSTAAKAGVKKASKEIASANSETMVKETVEAGTDVTKEVVEKLEVGDKIDKSKFLEYIPEIEEITGRELTDVQELSFWGNLASKDYVKLSTEATKEAHAEFNGLRSKLITEWEKMTGETWPTYSEDVVNDAGVVLREAGQPYDAHHIIELSTEGPNEWWNIFPAKFPDEHQAGIHGTGSKASEIFR